MKIIADDKIPYLNSLFSPFSQLIKIPGKGITNTDLTDASALLTRTVTTVNSQTLKNTAIQYVGSMTAGIDHIDTDYLTREKISWCSAPGSNASAVAEYVMACVAQLIQQEKLPRKFNAGIIGVGHVGKIVANYFTTIADTVIYSDPPRAKAEPDFFSSALSAFTELDLICIHTPLITSGPDTTHHLINNAFLQQLKPGCVIINAARGVIVDNDALLKNKHVIACLDVWEGEPSVNIELLKNVAIASPHIAGYSQQAKFNASWQVFETMAKHFKWDYEKSALLESIDLPKQSTISLHHPNWGAQILNAYNPAHETVSLRDKLLNAQDKSTAFEALRRNYMLRNELLIQY